MSEKNRVVLSLQQATDWLSQDRLEILILLESESEMLFEEMVDAVDRDEDDVKTDIKPLYENGLIDGKRSEDGVVFSLNLNWIEIQIEGESKPYIQKDLIDYGRIPTSVDAFNRAGWVEAALPEEASIQFRKSGGYTGVFVFVIRLNGYIWLFNDYYGSCSHCDSFIDREKEWTENMLRSAYCFESEEDALQYLEETDDFSWGQFSGPAIEEMIQNPQKENIEGGSE